MKLQIPKLPDNGEFIRGFLEEAMSVVQKSNEKSWKDESSPNTGKKWKPRVPPTGAWPILRKSGKMQDTAKFTSRGRDLLADIQDYGVYHMKGNPSTNLPVRDWLGIPESSLGSLEEILANQIVKGTKKS